MPDGVIGTTAGNYRILAKIGDGGMGTVYRAEHVLIGRTVAVKVLQPELTGNREIVSRFFNEAKATTAIKHPGIVEVFDFGYLDSGPAYIVMELLEGMTLARRAKTAGAMPEGEAASLLRSVCNALAAAHDKGIIHRDLKPDNIFLIADPDSPTGDRPKILDFGIAKLTDLGSASAATKTGAVMGTPTYMSPEQCRGSGTVDARADLYSLGCIFYQLVAGRPPFASQGAGEVIGMHLFMQPEPPSKHHLGISPDTDALIMALLQKDPAHRPQSARELSQQLAVLAHAHGWISASRPGSYDGLSVPSPTPHFTPAYSVPQPTPHFTPAVVAGPHQPTTLSGAASQSVVSPPKRRVGVGIAIVGALALVGGGIAFSVLGGGGDQKQAAIAPAPPVPAPPAAKPPPAPAPTPPTPPTPVAIPDVVVTPPTPDVPKKPIAKVPTKKPDKKPPDKRPPDKKPPTGDLPVETNVE